VVDRRFALGTDEKEKLRTLLRMYENFTGCRAVAYCLMSNHIHLLLEVPPMPSGGLSDAELLKRLSALYGKDYVAGVAKDLAEARERGSEHAAVEIHGRYAYRMHDLGQFMKGLLQRFTQWHNRVQERTGTLWEDRFKSVIVEDGTAAKTVAAYIDLNPVRAGMVKDPADYRWSSYGEAVGGGPKGNGRKARAGLVRALCAHKGVGAEADRWQQGVAREYRLLLLEGAVEKTVDVVEKCGVRGMKRTRKGMKTAEVEREKGRLGALSLGGMLRRRVRYFTDGAVIGSRSFVDETFAAARERFGPRRTNGARKLRGDASPAAGMLWSMRDLKNGVSQVKTGIL